MLMGKSLPVVVVVGVEVVEVAVVLVAINIKINKIIVYYYAISI